MYALKEITWGPVRGQKHPAGGRFCKVAAVAAYHYPPPRLFRARTFGSTFLP